MLSFLAPHLVLDRAVQLTAAELERHGRRGLLLDLDGTLKDYRAKTIAEDVVTWIEALRDSGVRLCLLSNGKHGRIETFAHALRVLFVASAYKPLPFGCHTALSKLGLRPSETAIVGDQLFADVLAGRLAGLLTILVRPLNLDEPWWTRLKRPVERIVMNRLEHRYDLGNRRPGSFADKLG